MTPDPLARAYATCQRLSRAHYENFPVASWMLPAAMRPHVSAVYAFARTADDFADEGARSVAERLALLDDWGARLGRAADTSDRQADASDECDQIFHALSHTMRVCELPVALFEDLLSAFRQDVTTHRYESWDQLLDYCRRSANPVGRLVLRIAGCATPTMDHASDCVCTALQNTNFLQDLGIDWSRGRLYVPAEIYQAAGAAPAALGDARLSAPWRDSVAEMARRTRRLFDDGRVVCDGVRGRLRWELRLTWLGGVRILDRLGRSGYDPLIARPALGVADGPSLLWRAATWSTRG